MSIVERTAAPAYPGAYTITPLVARFDEVSMGGCPWPYLKEELLTLAQKLLEIAGCLDERIEKLMREAVAYPSKQVDIYQITERLREYVEMNDLSGFAESIIYNFSNIDEASLERRERLTSCMCAYLRMFQAQA